MTNTIPLTEVEHRLWSAAETLWTNSKLRIREKGAPVLGLHFLSQAAT